MLREGGALVLCSLLLLIRNARIEQYKTALTVLSPGLERLHATLAVQGNLLSPLDFACHLRKNILHFEYMNHDFFRSHVAPGKEPFLGLVSVRMESGGGSNPSSTLCLFPTMEV